jgi:hypothetical protein
MTHSARCNLRFFVTTLLLIGAASAGETAPLTREETSKETSARNLFNPRKLTTQQTLNALRTAGENEPIVYADNDYVQRRTSGTCNANNAHCLATKELCGAACKSTTVSRSANNLVLC